MIQSGALSKLRVSRSRIFRVRVQVRGFRLEARSRMRRYGEIERDPTIIQGLEVVNFDSSFSEESQEPPRSGFLAGDVATGTRPGADVIATSENRSMHRTSFTSPQRKGRAEIQKKVAINLNTENPKAETSRDQNSFSSDDFSSDVSFGFSDDDEIILRAAAHHTATFPTQHANISTFNDLKRSAEFPPREETKKQIPLKSTNILGFHSIDFDKTESSFTNIRDEVKALNSSSTASTSISNDMLSRFASTERSRFGSIPFGKSTNQVSQIRSLSTTPSAKASSKKKAESVYHSIQFATQKPERTDKTFVVSADQLKNVKPIILSKEQEFVLQQVLNGTSLFYTGSAGTGKSVLLKAIIRELRRLHRDGGVAVTASTGLAACNIGGITLHSFAGVGLAKEPTDQLLKKLRKNRKAWNKWQSTKVLVIDEISMVDGDLLDKFNSLAKKVRKNNRPFGGIQLVVCGDFYQLPPVVTRTGPDGNELDKVPEINFSFESEAWKENIKETIILKEIFRQRGDQVFIDMLNEMRNGTVSERSVREFHSLSRPLKCPTGFVPTELFATRNEVDRANNFRLGRINSPAQAYSSIDTGDKLEPQRTAALLSNFLAPQQLFLKKDAQVMCIKNYDESLVNGSLGQVVDFVDKDTYLKAIGESEVEEESDYVFDSGKREENEQIQDSVESFDSLKKSTEKFRGEAVNENTTSVIAKQASNQNKDRKAQILKDLQGDSKDKKYPLVKFLLPDGVNTRTVLVEPELWTIENEKQELLASRVQLPLILAWSLSIHKSQGQTLPKVKVDLKNVFETGQSYVALSRAVSREGLQVLNFNEAKVRAHPKVIQFYKTLVSAEESFKTSKGQQKLSFFRETTVV